LIDFNLEEDPLFPSLIRIDFENLYVPFLSQIVLPALIESIAAWRSSPGERVISPDAELLDELEDELVLLEEELELLLEEDEEEIVGL